MLRPWITYYVLILENNKFVVVVLTLTKAVKNVLVLATPSL